jgi:cystathionine beta-synthase
MIDNGLLDIEEHGDLRDLITRRADKGQVVTVKTGETLATAYGRMRMFDVSQLPVMDADGHVVGLVDESDLMLAVYESEGAFNELAGDHMVAKLETLKPGDPIDALLPLFRAEKVAIVKDADTFYGLITRVDFINYLRKRGK